MEMIKRNFVVLILILSTTMLMAQKSSEYGEKVLYNLPVSLSYMGDYLGTKPGLNITFENSLKKTYLTKKNSKIVEKTLYNPINLGWYNHKGYNSALILSSGIGLRKTRQSGFITGIQVDLGLMRTFIHGTTYNVEENGEVSTVAGGYFYGNIAFSLEAGWDFSKANEELPLSTFVRLKPLVQFPYNGGSLIHIMAEFGLRTSLPFQKEINEYHKSKN
jgi:hypothetical protein